MPNTPANTENETDSTSEDEVSNSGSEKSIEVEDTLKSYTVAPQEAEGRKTPDREFTLIDL